MRLNPDHYRLVKEKFEAMPTPELILERFELENENYSSCPAKDDLISIIELELKKRIRQAHIEKLEKSLKASNPFGRLISGVKGFLIRNSKKS